MPIHTGHLLGSYEVLSAIGSGGMGDVYRAHDSRLGRDVALKVLRESFAADSDRVARFEREARVLAALNHPNIGAIYGMEEFDSTCALVMELVPGETLAERIQRDGAIPLDDALRIAVQIADALEAAHNGNIIHRDLKPANVKITPEGRVKVLDFGLAKLNPRQALVLSQAATLTSDPTETGRILGTPAYMSPEQAQGATIDQRSDVFSFGAVLYEMLSGNRAFGRASMIEVLTAVIKEDPAPLNVPAPVNSIVRRCVEKDPTRRFQSMAEVRAAVQQVAARSASPHHVTSKRLAVAVAVGAFCLVALGVAYVIFKSSVLSPVRNYQPVQLTALGYVNNAELSPDGTRLAFEWSGPGEPNPEHLALYVKTIGGETVQRVTEFKPGLLAPAWSPDGSQLAFQRLAKDGNGGIYLTSPQGGPEKKLYSTHATFGRSLSIAWSPDGKVIAFATAPFSGGNLALNLLSIDTLQAKQIEHNERCLDEAGPVFSHDGKYLAYNCYSASSDFVIAIARSDGSGSRIVKELKGYNNGIAWTGDDKSLLLAQFQIGTDGTYLRELTIGDGSVRDLPFGKGSSGLSMSAKGDRLVFAVESGGNDTIWRADLTRLQDAPVELISSTRGQLSPNYSPDGTHLVFGSNRTGPDEIWMSGADGQDLVQLTHLGASGSPSWSPDGKKIAFDSRTPLKDGSTHADVYVLDLADRIPRKLNVGGGEASIPSWSHDGKWIYFTSGDEGRHRIFRVSPEGGQTIAISTSRGFLAKESLDGQYVYFASSDSSSATLLRASLNPIGTETHVDGIPALSFAGNWTVVRDGVYFYPDDDFTTLSYFDFANKKVRPVLKVPQVYFGISVSPDGRYIVYAKHIIPKRDIMLIDHFR